MDSNRLGSTASSVVALGARLAARVPGLLKSRLLPAAVGLIVLVILPLLKFFVIPHRTQATATAYAESHGVKLEAKAWHANVLGLSATAEGVKLLATGVALHKELLTSERVDFKFSLWSALFGSGWLDEVRVGSGQVYVERFASGRWNWQEATPPSQAAVSPELVFSLLTMDNMQLEWTENFAEGRGRAAVRADNVSLHMSEVEHTDDKLSHDSPLSVSAQVHGGKVSFEGRADVFAHSSQAWAPAVEGRLEVERLPADVLVPITPEAAIVPSSGTLLGRVDIRTFETQLECQADLNYVDMAFMTNQASQAVKRSDEQRVAQLAGYRAGGHFQHNCGGNLLEDSFRPFQSSLIALVTQALAQAPRVATGKGESGFDKALDKTNRVLDTVEKADRIHRYHVGPRRRWGW